jgi:hypothetical protein
MPTKPRIRNDYVSSTKPDDPEAIPAFETSAGIKPRDGGIRTKPTFVNARALSAYNGNIDPDVQKFQVEAANVAALFAKRAIRPDEIAALRRRMFEVVTDGLEDVAEVMSGKKEWSNVQVRLFSILTERVMPKLSTITVEDSTSKKLDDLSIEELEKIALGKAKHQAVDAVVKQGRQLEKEAETSEAIAGGKVLAKLKHIASIDEAEKEYVKSKRQPKEVAGVQRKKSSPTQRQKDLPTSPKVSAKAERSETSGERKASVTKRSKPSTKRGST